MFNKRELVYLLKSKIEIDGFKVTEEEQGISWSKEIEGRFLYMYIGISSSSESFLLQHPFVNISFDCIEEKMKNLNVPAQFIYNSFTCKLLFRKELLDLGLRDTPISSESDFNLIFEVLKMFLDEINEFFKTINSPTIILDKLNSLEMKDAVNFLGQPLPLRKTVILFFVNNEEYLNYAKQIRKFLIETNSPLINAYNELLDRLDT